MNSRLLILLPMLLLLVGCGVDSVEDSNADRLDPASADFHFQDFPLAGGSLIPLEEIPVVTIEKTREDADFFYWQLKAEPAPLHEDLVVGVFLVPQTLVFFENIKTQEWNGLWEAGLALEDREVTVPVPLSAMAEHFVNEGYFLQPADWKSLRWTYVTRFPSKESSWYLSAADWTPIVVVIPKLQKTSQEFKLPLSYVVDWSDAWGDAGPWPSSGFIKANEAPELPPLGGDPAEAAEARISVVGNPVRVEDPSMMRYFLRVISPQQTTGYIAKSEAFWEETEKELALMDIPVFQTLEGYIIREGFAFSHYMLGEASGLDLQR